MCFVAVAGTPSTDHTYASSCARRFWCVEDNNACTRCVLVALLDAQDTETFEWTLRQYALAHKRVPETIFTDEDAAMLAAVRNVWPSTRHLYAAHTVMLVFGAVAHHEHTHSYMHARLAPTKKKCFCTLHTARSWLQFLMCIASHARFLSAKVCVYGTCLSD